MTHYDFLAKIEDSISLPPGPTGLQPLPDMLVREPRSSCLYRRNPGTSDGGRKRASSRERHAVCEPRKSDLVAMGGWGRFGSGRRTNGTTPASYRPGARAGGATWGRRYQRRTRRALRLRQSRFARCGARRVYRQARVRISSFDKQAIAETKRLVDIASLPSNAEIAPEWNAFLASLGRPASQTRIKALMERGFHRPGDVEQRLGYHVGQLGGRAD